MNYFEMLGLEREPFSTSPDPSFLYLSKEHRAALCRVQIAIALKRGLCVVLGDVGTGKTTLSRKLATILRDEEDVLFYMILNPYFHSEKQFLSRLAALFHIETPKRASALDLMEAIERFLFRCGVEEEKTVVLLIDESQILPEYVLETLRILLNYETNEYKMLQLVLVGQMELLPRISRMENFWDRIAMKYVLNPLEVTEVKELLAFRLEQAGYHRDQPLFTDGAVQRIWDHTRGYPRKVAQFCHNALESLVMHDRVQVDEDLVERLIAADVLPTDGEPSPRIEAAQTEA
jgi:general secretion pathway protein A